MSSQAVFEVRRADDPGLRELLDAAFAELVARYGLEGRSMVDPEARFVVATVDGVDAACAALQRAGDETAELKRMYVMPDFRGRGIARQLLVFLEDLARRLRYRAIRLATGVRQPEAMSLYEKCGYIATAPYGKYVDDPLCRCYSKPV